MKFILEITIVFAMVVVGEGYLKKVNPCAIVKCRAGTKCVVKYGRAFCQPDFCSLPAETGLCKAYIPRYFYNTKTGKCERFIYGGCGGNQNNFDSKDKCEKKCGRSGPCPPDKPLRYCIIAPCLYAKCPAHPGATCVNNYCGGCNADFYVGSKKVDCTVSPCPPLLRHYCNAAPCDVTKCPAYPKATCVNNYCGGCFADYYLHGQKVNCKKVLPTLPVTPPASCAAVTCFEDHKCVVIDGKATCKPVCKSDSDCKQQGSYCDTDSGLCECRRFCLLDPIQLPVCGSDGKQYGSLCKLDASACHQGTTITTVPAC